MNHVFDTSVIIKGILKPRRKKQDSILKEQFRVHKIATSFMNKIYSGKINLIIPSAALIEIAAVSSRLTGVKDTSIKTTNFINSISTVINESDILDQCIDVAAETKISGFDAVFIAVAKLTNSTLITDDKKMYESATKLSVDSKLLRDIK